MAESEKVRALKAQIEALKAERNSVCKKLKKLRQKLNQAMRNEVQSGNGKEMERR